MRKPSFLRLVIATSLLLVGSVAASAAVIRVSQETAPGNGVFVQLGNIDAVNAIGQTAAQFYAYASASYNGGPPAALSNWAQTFFVRTSQGLVFFQLLDARSDGSGGDAQMEFNILNDTVSVLVSDDNNEVTLSGGGTTVTGDWTWAGCCTDGVAFGALDGKIWKVFAEFSSTPTGLGNGWQAVSANGSTIALDMAPGRRARFELVPEPGTITMFGFGLLGLAALRRRMTR